MHTDGADHGQRVGAGAAKGHQVEEIVHEGASVLQHQEHDGYHQQQDVGDDGLLMLVQLGKGRRQEVGAAHGIQQAHRGQPEAQQAGANGAQDGADAKHDGEYAPAGGAKLLHQVDGQEAAGGRAALLHQGLRVHAAHADEEERVDHAAGNNRTPDGLGAVLDWEVAFLNHLRHGFKAKEGGNQEGHTDDPAGDAKGGLALRIEEVGEIIQAPLTGGYKGDGGGNAARDSQRQHDQLNLAGHFHVLQAQDEIAHQQHGGYDFQHRKAAVNVCYMENPLHNGHDRSRGHGNPRGHNQPGGQEAAVLVQSHGVVDQLAARLGEQRSQIAVYKRDGQNQRGHQQERQEGGGAAVFIEDRIPVTDEGEDRAGSDGVYVNELQAAVELILRQRAVDGIILSHKYSLSFLIRIFARAKGGCAALQSVFRSRRRHSPRCYALYNAGSTAKRQLVPMLMVSGRVEPPSMTT